MRGRVSFVRLCALASAVSITSLAGCASSTEEDEDTEGAVGTASDEATSDSCPRKAPSGSYALCVWTSPNGPEYMNVYGSRGLLKTFEVTTSNVDSDGSATSDGITCTGRRQLIAFTPLTSKKLENFFLFGPNATCRESGQGLHFYPKVGAGYDSHGCVRVNREASNWLAENVAPKVQGGKAVYIYVASKAPAGAGSMCQSQTLGRAVAPNVCVQRRQDQVWYRCQSDGNFAATTASDAACVERFPLR